MLLTQLAEALRTGVIRVLYDCARAVSGVELLDFPEAAEAIPPGQVLLGVGLNVADRDAMDLALQTAARTMCVLAVKCPADVSPKLTELARDAGVPLLAVNPQVPWTRVQRLLTTVLAGHAAGSGSAGSSFGGDLFSLANAVAAIVGGAVAIMDTQQVLVAYSSLPDQPIDEKRRRGILGRRVPEDALADHLNPKVWASDAVVRHHRAGDMPRLAVVISAGEDVLGSLWVAFPAEEAVTDCGATLHEAARVAALHMLALRRQMDADQESRDRVLRLVLEGRHERGGTSGAVSLPAVLIGLAEAPAAPELLEPGQDARRRATLMRLLDLAVLDGRSLGHGPAATLLGDRPYVLLSATAAGAVPADVLIQHILDRAKRSLHRSYLAVRSPMLTTPAALQAAYRAIDTALDHLGSQRAPAGAYRTEDLRPEIALRRLAETIRRDAELRTGIAERLRAHDAEHATDYCTTVATYLRHFGDVVAASAELQIHQNTLRQRLRRAEQLFGVALSDPTRRLLVTLELAALP